MSIGHIGENVLQQRELDNEYQYEEAYSKAYHLAEGERKRRVNCFGVSCEPHKSARTTNPSATFWYKFAKIILAFLGFYLIFRVLVPVAALGIVRWESIEEVHIEPFSFVELVILMGLDVIAGVLVWKYGKTEKQKE